jgi:hypothetical protein
MHENEVGTKIKKIQKKIKNIGLANEYKNKSERFISYNLLGPVIFTS